MDKMVVKIKFNGFFKDGVKDCQTCGTDQRVGHWLFEGTSKVGRYLCEACMDNTVVVIKQKGFEVEDSRFPGPVFPGFEKQFPNNVQKL